MDYERWATRRDALKAASEIVAKGATLLKTVQSCYVQ